MKINAKYFLILAACCGVSAQSQTPPTAGNQKSAQSVETASKNLPLTPQQIVALKQANELSATVARLYGQKKYDEALPVAEKALQLAEANSLFDVGQAASVLINLAEIYLVKKRDSDAAIFFEKAVTVLEKSGNTLAQAHTLERLAAVQSLQNSSGKAEKSWLKVVTLREGIRNGQTGEAVDTLLKVAKFYNYIGKPEKAESFYQRAGELSDKVYQPDDPEYNTAFGRYECWAYQNKGLREGGEYISKYAEKRGRDYSKPFKQNQVLQSGIVNGKAKRLVAPPYPAEARAVHVGGVVLVQVLIDETGKVIEAKTTCGYDVFAREAEAAALKSSFTLTLSGGQPVKVSGVIVYNFVSQ